MALTAAQLAGCGDATLAPNGTDAPDASASDDAASASDDASSADAASDGYSGDAARVDATADGRAPDAATHADASAPSPVERVKGFIGSISGTRTLAGQHNREPNSEPSKWTDAIYNATGKYPAFWSGDFLFEQSEIDARPTMIAEAKREWARGAVVQLMYHACPPTQGEACNWDGGVKSALTDDQWTDLITDGGALNRTWKSRLDIVAPFFADLQSSGVAVLFRPHHEMNQSVFWWGGRTGPSGTARLFQITHDYLTNDKGLHNIVWVWDVQDLDLNFAAYHPGDAYFDIAAMDMYGDGYTQEKYDTIVAAAGNKPIAIGECAVLPTAAELTHQPKWTFFMAWAELVFSNNSNQQISDVYGASNVITLDKMPGWH
jgi:mannan endo-1,4-beta-mannosidase